MKVFTLINYIHIVVCIAAQVALIHHAIQYSLANQNSLLKVSVCIIITQAIIFISGKVLHLLFNRMIINFFLEYDEDVYFMDRILDGFRLIQTIPSMCFLFIAFLLITQILLNINVNNIIYQVEYISYGILLSFFLYFKPKHFHVISYHLMSDEDQNRYSGIDPDEEIPF